MNADLEYAAIPGSTATSTSVVSVIIPCFKQAQYLGEAIESVLAQTHGDHEILVVDDGSPDHTAEVAARYPAVRYLRQPNRGLSAARNVGIQASRGDYLVFLDADDRVLPHHFATALEVFHRHPEVAMVAGDFRWFGSDDTWHVHDCTPAPDHYASMLRTGFIGPPHNVMIRRDVLLELGGFREDLRSTQDLDLWFRIARAYPMRCHCVVVSEYRRHSAQMSRKWGVMLAEALSVMREQWPYVSGNRAYEEAYYAGIARHRFNSGDPLLWQMVAALRRRDAGSAWADFKTLVRYYPNGLGHLVTTKLKRLAGLRR
jgi:glycosyltransferase involved in cell wall biosynthesis